MPTDRSRPPGDSPDDFDPTLPRRRRGARDGDSSAPPPPPPPSRRPRTEPGTHASPPAAGDLQPTIPRRAASARQAALDTPSTPVVRSGQQTRPASPAGTHSGAGGVGGVDSADPATQPGTHSAGRRPAEIPPPVAAGDGLGNFRLGDLLGQGGMGMVVHAHDRRLDRALAIKRIRDLTDRDAVAQFVEEAQITGQLEHPNIVPVHELGQDAGGRPWMAMKLVHGQTLSDIIRDERDARDHGARPLKTGEIGRMLDTVRKVADAIGFAHSRGVIHRDLKTENVMVGAFGEVLVMDWGLARADTPYAHGDTQADTQPGVRVVRRRDSSANFTMQGDVFGTPAFMAPEQARGEVDRVGPAADQFALGGILYHMLTLHEPYRGKDLDATLAAARERNLLPPHQRAPKRRIPRELSAVVMKAMATRPADRYPDVAAFVADLNAWQAHERTTAYRPPPWEAAGKWFRRHPTLGITGLTSLLLLVVFSALAWSLESSKQLAEQQAAFAEQQATLAGHQAARARAEQQAADAQAEKDRIALAVRNREFSELFKLTGERLYEERDAILAEYTADWEAFEQRQRAAGSFPVRDYFFNSLEEDRLRQYLLSFEKLFRAHDAFGLEVTAADYLESGSLKMRPQIGDYNGALADFSRALELDPDNVLALFSRGTTYARLGKRDEAFADYTLVIQLAGDRAPVEALLNRASALLESGDLQRALADSRQAIRVAPDDPRPHRYAGLALAAMGKLVEAIGHYDQAIQRKPDYYKAWTCRGLARAQLGQFDLAMADYDQAIAIANGGHNWSDCWLNRSRLHEHLGNLPAAIDDMTVVARLIPRDPYWRVDVARLQLDAGRPDAAIESCNAALAMASGFERAWRYRGRARMEKRDWMAAAEDLGKAIQFAPGDNYQAHRLRAECYLRQGKLADAVADLEAVLRMDPSDWEVEGLLAAHYATLGRTDESNAAALRAWRNCDNPQVKQMLAQQYRQLTGRDLPE